MAVWSHWPNPRCAPAIFWVNRRSPSLGSCSPSFGKSNHMSYTSGEGRHRPNRWRWAEQGLKGSTWHTIALGLGISRHSKAVPAAHTHPCPLVTKNSRCRELMERESAVGKERERELCVFLKAKSELVIWTVHVHLLFLTEGEITSLSLIKRLEVSFLPLLKNGILHHSCIKKCYGAAWF